MFAVPQMADDLPKNFRDVECMVHGKNESGGGYSSFDVSAVCKQSDCLSGRQMSAAAVLSLAMGRVRNKASFATDNLSQRLTPFTSEGREACPTFALVIL